MRSAPPSSSTPASTRSPSPAAPSSAASSGAAAAQTFKRVSLELGGKSANIIFADADLDAAASGAVFGVLVNTGQQCIAGSRVLVQRPVYDEMVERIATLAAAMSVGDPHNPATMCGPLISGRHLDRVLGLRRGRWRLGPRRPRWRAPWW